jgi:hypothetical protein
MRFPEDRPSRSVFLPEQRIDPGRRSSGIVHAVVFLALLLLLPGSIKAGEGRGYLDSSRTAKEEMTWHHRG